MNIKLPAWRCLIMKKTAIAMQAPLDFPAMNSLSARQTAEVNLGGQSLTLFN
jgi:hypothetical protein